jgi:hypothetical protein
MGEVQGNEWLRDATDALAIGREIGERVVLVNEQIIYGALKASTNQYYGGSGTSLTTVNGAITLGMVRKIVKAYAEHDRQRPREPKRSS